jgi:hypothetical protein
LKPRLYGRGALPPLPEVAWAGSIDDVPSRIRDAISAHKERAADALERGALDLWARGLGALPAELDLRRTLVQDSARAYKAFVETLLAEASTSAAKAEERASRVYRARADALRRQLDTARLQAQLRLNWLAAAGEYAERLRAALFKTLFVEVQVEEGVE